MYTLSLRHTGQPYNLTLHWIITLLSRAHTEHTPMFSSVCLCMFAVARRAMVAAAANVFIEEQ